MIEVEHLSKTFGKLKALDDVTFEVPDGQITAYVGLNGAGKTTTMRIIAGVIYPDSGDVKVEGHSVIREKVEASKNLAWVPELPIFEMEMKAIDYFVYIAGYMGYSTSEAKRLGKELLAEVGLEGAENKKLKDYSQGMKKRFALALSMISNPKNYLFDEVLNGLDPQGIMFFRDLALKLKKEGKAVLFSSHILSEVEILADKVVFIHKGRIIKVMSMDDIRKSVTNSLLIRVENPDKELVDVLSSYGNVEQNGNLILVRNFKGDVAEVNSKLSQKYKVTELRTEYASLEQVFFQIIQGEQK
ncbi:MAG: ABC transporter ATP-binding protein [Candidatus Aramenus sp.]|nr:ABC transporter ATP-binding protein [Candidatus Aramenus sp.]